MYFKKNRFTNRELLAKDFGEFPPRPLSVLEEPEYTIKIKLCNRVQYIIGDMVAAFNWRNIVAFEEFKTAVDSIKSINLIGKIVLILLLPVIIPFLLLRVLFIRTLWSSVINSIKILNRIFDKGYGHVNPIYGHYKIIIKKNKSYIKNQSENLFDCIVTHEFTHVMQQHDRLSQNNPHVLKDSQKCNLHGVVESQYYNDERIKYLYEPNELEARLHEIIVSGYPKHESLPLTKEGFFDYIMHNQSVLYSFSDKSAIIDGLDINGLDQLYEVRSEIIYIDIYDIFKVMVDDEMRKRFILEVLLPLYSNLLRYYGDQDSSLKILNCCDQTGLYKSIYI